MEIFPCNVIHEAIYLLEAVSTLELNNFSGSYHLVLMGCSNIWHISCYPFGSNSQQKSSNVFHNIVSC